MFKSSHPTYLDYFSEVGKFVKKLVSLTLKDNETDHRLTNKIIAKAEGAGPDVHVQLNIFLGLSQANKLAVKKY
jgi:hypothetical protein